MSVVGTQAMSCVRASAGSPGWREVLAHALHLGEVVEQPAEGLSFVSGMVASSYDGLAGISPVATAGPPGPPGGAAARGWIGTGVT
jgi:hypothetical protein